MNKKFISNLLLAGFSAITLVVLVDYNKINVIENARRANISIIDTINKHFNFDTSIYKPDNIEVLIVTSEYVDSSVLARLCNVTDYYKEMENISIEWYNKLVKLANKFYKVKDYDSYKDVLWKADSYLSRADEFENLRLDMERSIEHYKMDNYGDNPILVKFCLISETDTLKNCKLFLTKEFKHLNYKPYNYGN